MFQAPRLCVVLGVVLGVVLCVVLCVVLGVVLCVVLGVVLGVVLCESSSSSAEGPELPSWALFSFP